MVRRKIVQITPIHKIQGDGLWSPLAGETVRVRGVVTGIVRKGFFFQGLNRSPDPLSSDGIFVYSPERKPEIGSYLELKAEVSDYIKADNDKPVTQLRIVDGKLLERRGPIIEPVLINAENLPTDPEEQAVFLNGLEYMLVELEAGAVFIQPSNPFGDYVVSFDEREIAGQGRMIIDQDNPDRWYPSFRVTDYTNAPRLNVGAKLLSRVVGPLNYRASSYQVSVNHEIEVEPEFISVNKTHLVPESGQLTVLTLNGLNLDTHIESADKVQNPSQDIDDDLGDGRFQLLAQAVVLQAAMPDIVALQEIQDNDGAEKSDEVDASETYRALIAAINELSTVRYAWVDIAPDNQADGGQPGGNIRNGYLYNTERVDLIESSVKRLGETAAPYEGSRKPLVAQFRLKETQTRLAVINVHLASKRHQHSIFAPERPGYDAKLSVRVAQAELVRDELRRLRQQGVDYYVTGDFNDTEYSATLQALVGEHSVNLVMSLPAGERYDYNHRGKLQVLMHGIVSQQQMQEGRAEYEILHGNELMGITPGKLGSKPSDHAYVIARLKL